MCKPVFMRLSLTAALVFAAFLPFLKGQKLDHYDLLLFALEQNRDVVAVGSPRFLTAFNPTGYNNQPCFFNNQELYLTVQTSSDISQTEIYSLNFSSLQFEKVTSTPLLSEYSPTPIPGGKRFSVVRVEEDGAQRLWSFPLDRSDQGEPVFYDLYGIGYHCWLNDKQCALFLVGENGAPHTLAVTTASSSKPVRIVSNIGRCLQRLPDGKLAYIQKATEQTWFIKSYDPKTGKSEIITQSLPGSEDFIVLPSGIFLSGSGSKLYWRNPGTGTSWQLVGDLGIYKVREITRLAISPDGKKLAVVVR